MNIESFAAKYRLKVKRSPDDDGSLVINGKYGQVYEHSGSELAVSFTAGLDKNRKGVGSWSPKKWGNARQAALAAGMTVYQDGDSEGSLLFNPDNPKQAKLAIKIAGAKTKRQATTAQLANLAKFRQIPSVEQHLAL